MATAELVRSGASRGWARRLLASDRFLGIAFLAPAGVLILVIVAVPIAVAVTMAFLRVDLTRSADWTFNGLRNFGQIGTDELAGQAIPRSVYFATLVVAIGVPVAVGVALLLNETRTRPFMRTVALIPWGIAPLAAGTTWYLLFHYSYGGINAALLGIGAIPRYVSWLTDGAIALHAAVIGQIWLSVPLASLIILARLRSVPANLYRAAVMDGANQMQRFRYVTLPNLRTTLVIVALIETIVSLQTFDLIFALTRGGPTLQTVVFNMLIYQRGFVDLRLGYASALALILFTIVVVASLIVFFLANADRRRGRHPVDG